MNLDQLNKPKSALLAFGNALGIAEEIWVAKEESERIFYSSENIQRDAALSIQLQTLTNLIQALGDALTCKFKYGDLEVLNVDASLNQQKLDKFRIDINPSPLVKVEIRINKQILASRLFSTIEDSKVYFFIFALALEKHLNQKLQIIEKQVWNSGTTRKAVFFVPDLEIFLDGPNISVIGGSKLEQFNSDSLQKPTDLQTLQQMYAACQDNLKWQDEWITALTPLHFKIDKREEIETSVWKILAVHAAEIAILYTADRTVFRNGWISTYTGNNKSVQIQVKSDLRIIDPSLLTNVSSLIQLVEWVYEEGKTSDRLPLAQSAIARELEYSLPEKSYDNLLSNAKSIVANAAFQWKAFIEKKVQGYLGQVQALEDYIATTVNTYSANINALIKSLTDTMLAAVAAVAATFITTLLKEKGNPLIISLTVWLYALYVALFPLLFNMLNQFGQYKILSNDYIDRNNRFKSILFTEKVDDIVGDRIKNAKNRFLWWFFAAIVAYVLLIIALFFAGFKLPGLLNSVTTNETKGGGQPTNQNSTPGVATATPKPSAVSIPSHNAPVINPRHKKRKAAP
jgi:hypothetical protein